MRQLIRHKTSNLANFIDKALYDTGNAWRQADRDVYQKIAGISQSGNYVHYVIADKVEELNARANRG